MQQILGQWEISRILKVWVNGKHMLIVMKILGAT